MGITGIKKTAVKKRFLALLLACFAAFAFSSCTGVDPNVKTTESKVEKYKVETSPEDSDVLLDGYNAYGDGLTSPVTVKGVKVDVEAFALRSYELAFMLGQAEFKSIKDIPVDALAQYAVTHVFFKNFYEITNKVTEFRQAEPDRVSAELEKHFGKNKIDLKKSVLYNKGKNMFEIWVPEYGTNIFYNIDAADVNGSEVKIVTTFFNEFKKSTKLGRTEITVRIKDGKPVISKMSQR